MVNIKKYNKNLLINIFSGIFIVLVSYTIDYRFNVNLYNILCLFCICCNYTLIVLNIYYLYKLFNLNRVCDIITKNFIITLFIYFIIFINGNYIVNLFSIIITFIFYSYLIILFK